MKILLFCHSLVSDWNHGNAHFQRGICRDLQARGHTVDVWEPADGWSRLQLIEEQGEVALQSFSRVYPELSSRTWEADELEAGLLDRALDGADLVLVHEWSPHRLVRLLGERRRAGGEFVLLFHDTHHRSVSDPDAMGAYDLSGYDGVLAFGDVVRHLYLERGWAERAWTWHEAADVTVFHPPDDGDEQKRADLVWIGNWGDEERTAELTRYLLEPVSELGLSARVHGVRYPDAAKEALSAAGIEYGGWLPNHRVPEVFARHRLTVHVPRRPYVEQLPGIPTIRVFEALACGIPLVCSWWDDSEGLFTPGEDYLVAHDGEGMKRHLAGLLADPERSRELAAHGRRTILERHTCSHRVDELLAIYERVSGRSAGEAGGEVAPGALPGRPAREPAGGGLVARPGGGS